MRWLSKLVLFDFDIKYRIFMYGSAGILILLELSRGMVSHILLGTL